MAQPFTIYKLIVLYMVSHSEKEVSNSQITDFILERGYTSYFHLQQAISELMESRLLEKRTISNTSYYSLTEEGKAVLSALEAELSSEIRKDILDYLRVLGCKEPERILTPADCYETPQGNYAVRCQLVEKNTTLIDLNLIAPSQEAARSICRSWPKKSQNIYELIMEELL